MDPNNQNHEDEGNRTSGSQSFTMLPRPKAFFREGTFLVEHSNFLVSRDQQSIDSTLYLFSDRNEKYPFIMSNIRGLYDDKDDDSKDDNRDSNNRYVGGIGSQGGGRSVGWSICVLFSSFHIKSISLLRCIGAWQALIASEAFRLCFS